MARTDKAAVRMIERRVNIFKAINMRTKSIEAGNAANRIDARERESFEVLYSTAGHGERSCNPDVRKEEKVAFPTATR